MGRSQSGLFLVATAVDFDDEDEPSDVIARLRRARKAVAEHIAAPLGVSVDKAAYPEDKIMEAALEAGADDVIDDEDVWTIHTAMTDFTAVRDALEAAGIAMQNAELAMIPQNLVAVSADMGMKVLRLMDALDDNDDVQNVYANADFPDDMPTD